QCFCHVPLERKFHGVPTPAHGASPFEFGIFRRGGLQITGSGKKGRNCFRFHCCGRSPCTCGGPGPCPWFRLPPNPPKGPFGASCSPRKFRVPTGAGTTALLPSPIKY